MIRTSLTRTRAHNANAKNQNKAIVANNSFHESLQPFHDLSTNTPIKGFPKNLDSIVQMGGECLHAKMT